MRPVALFGMNFMYYSGDPSLFRAMSDLGLERSNPLICSEHENKCILATKYDYCPTSYDDKEEFVKRYNIIETYTFEDFLETLRKELDKEL